MSLLRRAVPLAVAIAGFSIPLAGAAPALASSADPGSCAPNGRTFLYEPESQCTLWQSNVPVYSDPYNGPGQQIVGRLVVGGRANWFTFECRGAESYLGASSNDYWAYTEADNGRTGYVPLTYFTGGADNQASSVLPGASPGAPGDSPYNFC